MCVTGGREAEEAVTSTTLLGKIIKKPWPRSPARLPRSTIPPDPAGLHVPPASSVRRSPGGAESRRRRPSLPAPRCSSHLGAAGPAERPSGRSTRNARRPQTCPEPPRATAPPRAAPFLPRPGTAGSAGRGGASRGVTALLRAGRASLCENSCFVNRTKKIKTARIVTHQAV